MTSVFGTRKAKTKIAAPCAQDLRSISDLVEAGKVKPVIDRCYPLERLAEAYAHAETGHARGKIVVAVADKLQVQDTGYSSTHQKRKEGEAI